MGDAGVRGEGGGRTRRNEEVGVEVVVEERLEFHPAPFVSFSLSTIPCPAKWWKVCIVH
jgi:hypothetical protein